jgi:hypothetical protein
MQELKGRPTKVTEGNAKGSYVSYVIEEDVSGYKSFYLSVHVAIFYFSNVQCG